MDRLADLLARRARILTLLVLASAVLPASYIPGLRIDNSIEVWVRQDGEELVIRITFIKQRQITAPSFHFMFTVTLFAKPVQQPSPLPERTFVENIVFRIRSVEQTIQYHHGLVITVEDPHSRLVLCPFPAHHIFILLREV